MKTFGKKDTEHEDEMHSSDGHQHKNNFKQPQHQQTAIEFEKGQPEKKEVLVNSMNAYDRRIFHLAIEKIDGVSTKSIGDGQFKKIKV